MSSFRNVLIWSILIGSMGAIVAFHVAYKTSHDHEHDHLHSGVCNHDHGTCSHKHGKKAKIDINNSIGKENLVDVVVIGSGPAGYGSALYTSRFNRRTIIITGEEQGGQLMNTSHVENWPGVKKMLGPDIMAQAQDQALSFGAKLLLDTVEKIDTSVWPYVITTENGVTLHALSIIAATGASPRMLGVPGEKEYWGGKGVTSCAICDGPFYKQQDVVVVGGGDSAVEEAIQLAPFAKNITILIRKDRMRATAAMQDRLKGYPTIKVMYNVEITKILGNEEHVTSIELLDNKHNTTSVMPINGVFLAAGHIPNTKIFKHLVELNEAGYIKTLDRSQKTTTPGIFAAGDVEDDTYRQAGVAAGRGIIAAIDADRFLAEVGLDEKMAEKLAQQYFTGEKKSEISLENLESFADLNKEIQADKQVIVLDFYTDTCSSCKQMMPTLKMLAAELQGKAKFFKVDAEEATDLAEKFAVHKVPTLIVLKDGALVARFNEALGKKELTDTMNQFV